MKKDPPAELSVIAREPFRVYYEGPAKAVSGSNAVGQFDILPGHADFFSVMTPGEVIVDTNKDSIKFNVANGIISVRGNEVMLFVNM